MTPRPTVIVTRAADQADPFAKYLEESGFSVIVMPVLQTVPAAITDTLRKQISALQDRAFDWLVFSSANGVTALNEIVMAVARKPLDLKNIKIAVQGPKTAEQVEKLFGRVPDLMPESYQSEELLKVLTANLSLDDRVFLALAADTRGVLERGLREAGIGLEIVAVYQTVPAVCEAATLDRLMLLDGEVIFTFLSPSAFEAVLKLPEPITERLRSGKIASIGAVTSAAVSSAGYQVSIEARQQTAESLVAAIIEAYPLC